MIIPMGRERGFELVDTSGSMKGPAVPWIVLKIVQAVLYMYSLAAVIGQVLGLG